MLIQGDIEYEKDVYYVAAKEEFVHDLKVIRIEKPVFYIDTLHSCYCHLIENILRLHWVLNELIEANYLKSKDVFFFVKKENFLKFPEENLKVMDIQAGTYKGAWKDLFTIFNKNQILFEPFLPKDTIFHFAELFKLHDDVHQYSPWNCFLYYTGRTIPEDYKFKHLLEYGIIKDNSIVCQIRFTDETIKQRLLSFRKDVLQTFLESYDDNNLKRRVVIVNRKDRRRFPKGLLDAFAEYFSKKDSYEFTGTFYLEDMSFPDQVKLFNTNDVFVMFHGAGCTNMIWAKKNSVLLECNYNDNNYKIYDRLCNLLDITKHNMNLGVGDLSLVLNMIF